MAQQKCKTCEKLWETAQMVFPTEGYCTVRCRSYSVYRQDEFGTHNKKANTDISSFKGEVKVLPLMGKCDSLASTETANTHFRLSRGRRKERLFNFAQARVKRGIKKIEGQS